MEDQHALIREKVVRSATAAPDPDVIEELRDAFLVFDSEKNEWISAKELKAIMKAFGLSVAKEELLSVFSSIGRDISEGISFNEYLNVMIPRVVRKRLRHPL